MKKKLIKTYIIMIILLGIYGIMKINMTLPEIVRDQSSFSVFMEKDKSQFVFKYGEVNVILDLQIFENFQSGAKIIYSTIAENIEKIFK